jgi:hypothetical protein
MGKRRAMLLRTESGYDARLNTSLTKGALVGLGGGLLGTLIMDLFGLAVLLLFGGPASISFAIIGDSAASLLSKAGIDAAGGAPLGAALHYLIGLALGILFCAAVSYSRALYSCSMRRSVVLGILFVEAMSVPMLVSAAVLLEMTPTEMAEYFATSFVMHLIFGGVLGLAVSCGLGPAIEGGQRPFWVKRRSLSLHPLGPIDTREIGRN